MYVSSPRDYVQVCRRLQPDELLVQALKKSAVNDAIVYDATNANAHDA
jgi:hypothetical protein